MSMFVLQVVLFIAVAFGLGCLFGCWLKGRIGTLEPHSGAAATGEMHHESARSAAPGGVATSRAGEEPAAAAQPSSPVVSDPVANAEKSASPGTMPAAVADAPAKRPAQRKPGKPGAAKVSKGKTTKGRTTTARVSEPRAAKSAKATPKPKSTKPQSAKDKQPETGKTPKAVPDNLKKIKGVGPVIEAKLNAAGINSFAQIAAWSKKEQIAFAEQLSFAGRIEREEWVRQAKLLAKGEATEFSERAAKGDVAGTAGGKPKAGGQKR